MQMGVTIEVSLDCGLNTSDQAHLGVGGKLQSTYPRGP
jgi:hypothetical protein